MDFTHAFEHDIELVFRHNIVVVFRDFGQMLCFRSHVLVLVLQQCAIGHLGLKRPRDTRFSRIVAVNEFAGGFCVRGSKCFKVVRVADRFGGIFIEFQHSVVILREEPVVFRWVTLVLNERGAPYPFVEREPLILIDFSVKQFLPISQPVVELPGEPFVGFPHVSSTLCAGLNTCAGSRRGRGVSTLCFSGFFSVILGLCLGAFFVVRFFHDGRHELFRGGANVGGIPVVPQSNEELGQCLTFARAEERFLGLDSRSVCNVCRRCVARLAEFGENGEWLVREEHPEERVARADHDEVAKLVIRAALRVDIEFGLVDVRLRVVDELLVPDPKDHLDHRLKLIP